MRQAFCAMILFSIALWPTGCSNRRGDVSNTAAGTSTSQPSPSPPPSPPPPPPLSPQPTSPVAGPEVHPPDKWPLSLLRHPRCPPCPSRRQQLRARTNQALRWCGVAPNRPRGHTDELQRRLRVDPRRADFLGVRLDHRAGTRSSRKTTGPTGQARQPSDLDQWMAPEDGPFQTHIEDRRGNRLSAVIELR